MVNMDDHNLYRVTTCIQCGRLFKDDCGWEFCSGICEDEWDREHMCCKNCGDELGEHLLDENGLCEDCIIEEENE